MSIMDEWVSYVIPEKADPIYPGGNKEVRRSDFSDVPSWLQAAMPEIPPFRKITMPVRWYALDENHDPVCWVGGPHLPSSAGDCVLLERFIDCPADQLEYLAKIGPPLEPLWWQPIKRKRIIDLGDGS
jgi:hypothetical protein